MPMQIYGVYSNLKSERHESGRAPVGRTSKAYWLVVRKNSEYFALQQLDESMLPSRLTRTIKKSELETRYTPEPLVHKDYLLPYLATLKQRLADEEQFDPASLSQEQRQIYNCLLVLHAGSASGGYRGQNKLVAAMLNELATDEDGFATAISQRINRQGIDLRKLKNYDGAINYYQKAIELSPYDDHLVFNMARAFYEKGDLSSCRDNLGKALRLNPELRLANRFIRHLDRIGPRGRRR